MKRYLYCLIWIIITALLFCNSGLISNYTYTSVMLCAKNILPVLFPYSIMASLMVSLGINEILSKLFPVSKAFLLPDIASPAILTGAICGFPLGTKVACDMYESNVISKEDAETIISVSSFASPAFVINVIGKLYFKNYKIGVLIYFSHILSTITASYFINGKHTAHSARTYSQLTLGTAISRAIESAVISSLYVCGYITVFSIIVNSLGEIPMNIKCAVASLLEFSSAARFSSEINGIIGLTIAAFSVGWSGLSVLFQTMSMSAPLKLSLSKYVKVKIISGLFCSIYTLVYFKFKLYTFALILCITVFLAFAFALNEKRLPQIKRKSI